MKKKRVQGSFMILDNELPLGAKSINFDAPQETDMERAVNLNYESNDHNEI